VSLLSGLPVPEVGSDEVLIHVEVADVAVWDPFEREGGFAKLFGIEPRFPYVLGTDGAGTIATVGGRVRRFESPFSDISKHCPTRRKAMRPEGRSNSLSRFGKTKNLRARKTLASACAT
jgi:NADPH:quinone reductase-like Zn-dependent oxidoreductase